MTLPAPPIQAAAVVPENRIDPRAAKIPKFILGFEWLRYLDEISAAIDNKPDRKAAVRRTALSASVGTTPLPLGTVAPGVWRISYVIRVTTPATLTSSLQVILTWTAGGVTQTVTGAAITGNTTDTVQGATVVMRVDSATPISYSVAYVSTGATPAQFTIDLVAEALALDEV